MPETTEKEDLGAKTTEDLRKFEAELIESYKKRRPEPGQETRADLDELKTLATQLEEVRAELSGRSFTEPVLEVVPDEAEENVESEGEDATQTESETPAEPEQDVAPPPIQPGDETPAQPQAVAASSAGGDYNITVPPISKAKIPADAKPRESTGLVASVTAAGDISGFSAGQKFSTPSEVGLAFAEKAEAFFGTQIKGKFKVATVHGSYPDARTLDPRDSAENTQKLWDAIGPAAMAKYEGNIEALTAAGGLCAPIAPSYELSVIATADRPVRDALPQFGATRGGIRWLTPPSLSDVSGAITVWTEANDTTPGSDGPATKNIVTITCGTENEAVVDAIVMRFQTGNFARRTFPEQFDAWYRLGLAMHARTAEGRLLQRMAAVSTLVSDGQNLGATRDLLHAWGRAAAAYRSRQRMSPRAPLTLLAPYWVRDVMREDLLRQMPGDATLAVADAEIDGYIRARGLQVSWYMDTTTGAATSQIYGAQGAGVLLNFITTIRSYMFPPGTFVFLDGGRLDLGIDIRDVSLNETNNVQSFMETFEGVARTGHQALAIDNVVCVSGEASALTDLVCPVGS